MKTLKQIREEYKDAYEIQETPEKLMLESGSTIPSTSDMPSMLLFRRVSYRMYPGKQVVALYYSKLVDKYLSIPFGPKGNLNLSEAVIYDSLEDLEEGLGDYIEKGRQYLQNKVKDSSTFKAAQEIGHHLPGYENVKASKEKFSKGDYLGAAKEAGKSVAKAVGTGAAVAVGARALPSLAKTIASRVAGGNKGATQSQAPEKTGVDLQRDKTAKTYSSWENKPDSDPVYKARMKAQALAPIKENKIADIRKMVKEGIDTADLHINGRTVTLNTSMAKRILEVYDSVNTKNKKIVESMLNEDLESFKKLINFSIRK